MRLIAAVSAVAAVLAVSGTPPVLVTREVYLMGTQARLASWSPDRAAGLTQLEALLQQLERTEAQLSTWRPESEVSRLNAAAGRAFSLSPSLCATFAQIDRWTAATGGAFDASVGALTGAWDLHGRGRLPSAGSLARARARSGWSRTRFDARVCSMTLPPGGSIDVGGFGKGDGLDRARLALGGGAAPWMMDLGGQVAVNGAPPGAAGWEVSLAHPRRRAEAVGTIRMSEGSLATSAGSERDLLVEGSRIGHILDPRTGHPAPFQGAVAVWHERALAADVLSTALFVKGVEAGLRWADEAQVAACYLVEEQDGRVTLRPSRAFARRFSGA